jgi:glycosyltransferase involved in cell wall biosynthesis
VNRRILLLVTDLEIGGTPTVVRELAIRLKETPEVCVEVACLAKWGPVADQLREAGVAVTALGASSIGDIGAIAKLIQLIRIKRFDTVFSFLIHANTCATIAKLFVRDVRFIQSIQTTQPWPRWHWKLQAIVQEAAERIIVPSPSVAEIAVKWANIPQSKIEVIPNAVEIAEFQDVILRRKTNDKFAIGFIGRLDRIKRVPDLIQAMTMLDERYVLHIFGDGEERFAIEKEIDRLGLQARVTMHGASAKPQAALAQIDLLVLPSEAEGFGLVLIEAMAAKIPVIATNVAGIRDVVQHRKTGLLVPVANPGAIADAILEISMNEPLRAKLVRKGYEDVTARFSWKKVMEQYRML